MRQDGRAFTLIELAIVIMVIGVLAAIAIPAYQDYTVRSQVTEGLMIASGVKVGIAEAYGRSASWPADLAMANVRATPSGKYVEQVTVSRGTIFIEYGGASNANISGRVLTVRPTLTTTGTIDWSCGYQSERGLDPPTGPAAPHSTTIPQKFLPADCRR